MHSQASKIKWNSFFSFLSAFIRLLTNFILFAGIARLYGGEAFGQFATAHSLSLIFLLLADFGFDTLLATEIARRREHAVEIAQKYFSLKVLFALGTALLMVGLPVIHRFSGPTTTYIMVFSLYVFFSSLNNCFFALFRGLEQLHHETRISFVSNMVLLFAAFLVGFYHFPLSFLAIVFVGTRIIGLILALRVKTAVPWRALLRFDLSGWEEVRSRTLVFGFHYLFGNLFFTMDSMLLAFWRGDHEVGVYQSVFKIAVLALAIPDIVIGAILPVLSRLYAEDRARWMYLGQLVNKTLLFLVLPISMVFIVYADQLIHTIYGPSSFDEAVPLLRIFAGIVLVRFAVESFALMLTTSLQQEKRLLIVVAATAMNFILNYFMIRQYSFYGAAIVSLVTNLAVGFGYIFFTRSYFSKIAWDAGTIISVLATLAIGALLWQLKVLSMWYFAPIAVSLCVATSYFAGYSRSERSLIFSFNARVRNG
jgi:O-antigen/teichoic acid export membrane protein